MKKFISYFRVLTPNQGVFGFALEAQRNCKLTKFEYITRRGKKINNMLKNIYIMLLLSYFVFSCTNKEVSIQYYSNGTIKSIYEVVDSLTPNNDTIKLIDGLGQFFYPSGNKMAEIYYHRSQGLTNPNNDKVYSILVKDKRDGSYKLYFDKKDEIIEFEGEYNDGKIEYQNKFNELGEFVWKKSFHDNGELKKLEIFYNHDNYYPTMMGNEKRKKQDDLIEELREYNEHKELVNKEKYYYSGSVSYVYSKQSDGSSSEENFAEDGRLESKMLIENINGELSGRLEKYNNETVEVSYLHDPRFDMYFDSVLIYESEILKTRKLYEHCFENETSLYQIENFDKNGNVQSIEYFTTRYGNCDDVYVYRTESLNSEGLPNLSYKDAVHVEDGSVQKAKKILGQPDIKGCMKVGAKYVYVYFNKINHNGKKKHLVLFIRDGYPKMVEDVQAVSDGERAYFGIHYIECNDYQVTGHIK